METLEVLKGARGILSDPARVVEDAGNYYELRGGMPIGPSDLREIEVQEREGMRHCIAGAICVAAGDDVQTMQDICNELWGNPQCLSGNGISQVTKVLAREGQQGALRLLDDAIARLQEQEYGDALPATTHTIEREVALI